jgi:hypothetical protein
MRTDSRFLLAASSFLLMISLGCQKNQDALLYVKPIQVPKTYNKVHNIRETATVNYGSDLDILWVIDNSGSMDPHQQAVINNASLFMQNFSAATALNWKMGLISTTDYDQPYIGFTSTTELNSLTTNPIGLFQSAVARLGTGGDYEEKTFQPILNAVTQYSFLRSDAYLAIIVVTDEEEQSLISPQAFINQIVAIKGGDPKKVITYGVFASTENCGFNGNFDYLGSRFESFMNLSQGTKFSLCAPDFGNMLSSIGANLISKVTTYSPTILLQARPQPNSIVVNYQGHVLPGGLKSAGGMWIYNPQDNAIVFHDTSFIVKGINDVTVTFDVDVGEAPKPKAKP